MMWGLLADLLVRSGSIMLAAEVLRRLTHRAPAAYRHRLIVWAFSLLLCWPLLFVLLPQVSLPIWWGAAKSATVTVTQINLIQHPAGGGWDVPWLLLVWLLGCALALTPVVAGYWRFRREVRQAEVLSAQDWLTSLASCGGAVGLQTLPLLLLASSPVMPQTFGLRRAYLLLPRECLGWSEARRRAVLLHELAHVQRHDVQGQLLAHFVTALWWFQPLCWLSRRSLRREAEEACDATVLACGVRASDYAAELLDIAAHFRRIGHGAVAIAITGPSSIERRLQSILMPPDAPVQIGRPGLAFSVLLLFAISASALTVGPSDSIQTTGVISMKRTIFSGLLTSAGLSAAMITGSLNDGRGGAVADAKASLYNPDTAFRQESRVGATGKFAFENLPAGAYILRVDKPGYAPVLEEFNIAQNAKVDRGLTLPRDGVAQTSAAQHETSTSSPKPDGPGLHVDPSQQQAKLISKVQPTYPVAAKAAAIQGNVILEMIVSTDGVPKRIHVLSSPDPELAESALEAVRQWRYSPMQLNGQPVEVSTEVLVSFTLMP